MALGTPRQLLTAALTGLLAVQVAAAQPAARGTEVQRLHQLHDRLSLEFQQDHAIAVQWANQHGLPVHVNHPDGRVSALMYLRNGRPCAYVTHNVSAADSVSTDELWAGGSSGLDLDGTGVLLHEWDGSEVRLTHQEFTGGAVSWADNTNYGYSSHSTHVAGTLVAAGVDASARGMSYAATVDAYDFYDDNAEMAAAAAAGARLSNHSYGWIRGWYYNSSEDTWYWYGDPAVSETEDASFGFYDASSRDWDEIAYDAPYYLICKSAGNDRNDAHDGGHYAYGIAYGWEWSTVARDADGGATGYDTISQQGCAKNILTVGAVYDVAGGYTQPSDVIMSSFSGWGPTDDGRVKPDIVANGTTLYSAIASSDTAYGWYSGTSMSTPSTCGSLGLLVQHHRATHAEADMRAATLKGLVIHTADECGAAPGPDYSFGWGLLNTLRAADYITQDETAPEVIQELSLAQGETHSQSWIYDGENPVMATICWTDPAGTPVAAALDPPDLMLVNDLDLRIVDPDGVTHSPWRLDPAAPAAAATRGDNFRDNVEVVLIDNPIAGIYTIEVTHKGTLVGAPQDFALILTPPTAEPGACGPGEILDCNGNCAPASWYGDGFCDDGSSEYNGVPIDFSCAELDDDDGDCPAATPGAWDILWRDQLVGVAQAWLMDGNQVTEQAPVAVLDPAVWTIAGLDDFNGDGQCDILWYKTTTGKTYLYLMNGTQPIAGGPVITLNPLVWAIAGVGDFNGDGKSDILWRRLDTGKTLVHLMDGFTILGQGKVVTLPPDRWSLVGVGDFNRDGKSDIVWRRTDTGKTMLYLMDGYTRIGQGNITVLNPDVWAVVGIRDFDGDGRADILWRRIDTGKTMMYLMDGYERREQGNVGTLSPATWAVAGLGDLNADGRADILWRRLDTGNTLLFFMDGYQKIGQGSAGSVDLIWDVVGLGDLDGPP